MEEESHTDSSADSNIADDGSNQSDAEGGRNVCLAFYGFSCDFKPPNTTAPCLPLSFFLLPSHMECRSYGFVFAHVGISSERGFRLALADQVITEYTKLKTIWDHLPVQQSIDMTTVPDLSLAVVKYKKQ